MSGTPEMVPLHWVLFVTVLGVTVLGVTAVFLLRWAGRAQTLCPVPLRVGDAGKQNSPWSPSRGSPVMVELRVLLQC